MYTTNATVGAPNTFDSEALVTRPVFSILSITVCIQEESQADESWNDRDPGFPLTYAISRLEWTFLVTESLPDSLFPATDGSLVASWSISAGRRSGRLQF